MFYVPVNVHSVIVSLRLISMHWLIFTNTALQGQMQQDKQCTYKRNIEARSRNHCCDEKPVLYILSVCL
jgi:hypothetical protein